MEKPRLHSPRRHAKHLRDLQHTQLLNMVKHERIAMLVGELRERLAEAERFPICVRGGVGPALGVRERRAQLSVPAPLAQPVSVPEVGHAMRPRRERRAAFVAMDRLQRLDERLLRQLIRGVLAAREVAQPAVDRAVKGRHEPGSLLFVARKYAPHPFAVVHRRFLKFRESSCSANRRAPGPLIETRPAPNCRRPPPRQRGPPTRWRGPPRPLLRGPGRPRYLSIYGSRRAGTPAQPWRNGR